MARSLTYDQLLGAGARAASKRGARLIVLDGAKDRCRCCSGPHNPAGPFIRPWGTYIAIIRHITGGGLGSRTLEQYCWDILINDPSVPFKVQWAVGPGGREIVLLGTGRANHCLNMSQPAYDALVNESMALDQFCQNLRGSALVGSTFTLGIEQVAASAPDLEQSKTTDALELELISIPSGWNGGDTAGHGEVASDRGLGDPNENMGAVRQRLITAKAGGGTPPPPPTIDRTEHAMRLVRNSTTGSTFDKGFGAVYLTGPAVWQHVPSIEQLNALQLAWGPYIDVGDADLAKMRDAYWTTLDLLRVGLDPNNYSTPSAPEAAAEEAPTVDDVEPSKTEAEADMKEQGEVIPGAGGSDRVLEGGRVIHEG